MTTADRLERLHAAMTDAPWRAEHREWPQAPAILRAGAGGIDSAASAESLATLRNALPELVAVVRAAEIVEETGALPIDSEWADLTAALAALDARLTETDSGDGLESPSGVEGDEA